MVGTCNSWINKATKENISVYYLMTRKSLEHLTINSEKTT